MTRTRSGPGPGPETFSDCDPQYLGTDSGADVPAASPHRGESDNMSGDRRPEKQALSDTFQEQGSGYICALVGNVLCYFFI